MAAFSVDRSRLRPRELRCPICKKTDNLVCHVWDIHTFLKYSSNFDETTGSWSTRGELPAERTEAAECMCIKCSVFGTEALFDPSRKPPRLYHDRSGYYVKLNVWPWAKGLFEKTVFKCYISETTEAGRGFIGILKVAAVKTAAELPELLIETSDTVVAYAKVRLRELRSAARKKKKKRKKK